ncbi:unnamed protein product, partial [Tilletia laevis]
VAQTALLEDLARLGATGGRLGGSGKVGVLALAVAAVQVDPGETEDVEVDIGAAKEVDVQKPLLHDRAELLGGARSRLGSAISENVGLDLGTAESVQVDQATVLEGLAGLVLGDRLRLAEDVSADLCAAKLVEVCRGRGREISQ